jgi:isoleucyl-tRNA synthetase
VIVKPEEVEVLVEARPGFDVETDGRTLVALDTTLTPELVREGLVREIVKRVNNSRREAGLRVEDRIELHVAGAAELLAAAAEARAAIERDTLATKLSLGGDPPSGAGWRAFEWDVDGAPLSVRLRTG